MTVVSRHSHKTRRNAIPYYIPGPAGSDYTEQVEVPGVQRGNSTFGERLERRVERNFPRFRKKSWHVALEELSFAPYGRQKTTACLATMKGDAAQEKY